MGNGFPFVAFGIQMLHRLNNTILWRYLLLIFKTNINTKTNLANGKRSIYDQAD